MKFPDRFTIISDEIAQDLATIRAVVREFGLPGIELRSLNGRAFKDLTADDIAEVSRLARGEGWKIFGCATPVFKCDLDDAAAVREHREIFRRSLDTARALECDLLRVFTFLRRPNPTAPGLQPRVAAHLHELLALAEGSGVRLGIENEHSCLVATADELAAVLAALPADRVGGIWDPCNVLYVPGAATPTPEESARLVPRLFHVHLKDAAHRAGAPLGVVGTPIGAGEVGWRAQLRALRDAGYRGAYSLETHWRLQPLDEALLHLPAGHAFSHGGEAASRICLHIIKALAETL